MSVNPFKYTRSHTHSCGMACFCCRQIHQDDTQQHRNGHENENDREEWINLHSYIRSFSTVFYCNSSVWQSNIGRHCQRAFCVGVRYHLPPCWRCRRHFCRRLPCYHGFIHPKRHSIKCRSSIQFIWILHHPSIWIDIDTGARNRNKIFVALLLCHSIQFRDIVRGCHCGDVQLWDCDCVTDTYKRFDPENACNV